MTLRRKAIRLAIVDAIKNAVPEFGGRVFAHKGEAAKAEECPAAIVYAVGESIEQLADAPVWQKRTARFAVHISTTGLDEDDLEDRIDELAQKVEDALWRDEPLWDKALTSRLTMTGVEGPEISAEGNAFFADIVLVWEVLYELDPLADHEPEDDFLTARAEFETHEARAGAEAESEVELEAATP